MAISNNSLIEEILNPGFLNALATLGLFFVYFSLSKMLRPSQEDKGRFFRIISYGWFANVTYLWVFDPTRGPDTLPTAGTPLAIILLLNAVTFMFFLAGSGLRLRHAHPRLHSTRGMIYIVASVAIAMLLDLLIGSRDLMASQFATVTLGVVAITALGRSYQSFFRLTRLKFPSTAKSATVYPLYAYAALQFGFLATGIWPAYTEEITQSCLYLGALLKLTHMFGLMQFAVPYFFEYAALRADSRQNAVDARTLRKLVEQLAHEVNTPSAALTVRLDQLKEEAKNPTAILAELKELTNLTEQIQSVVASFQISVRVETECDRPQPETTCNLNNICDSAVMTLKITTKTHAKFQKHFCARPFVWGRESEFVQIIRNVIKNAIEALGHQKDPVIVIRTSVLRAAEKRERTSVHVEISDNGPGVVPYLADRIFDDSFTTKSGAGHGHGLHIASTLARKYNGSVELENAGDKSKRGACFSITIPYHAPRGG